MRGTITLSVYRGIVLITSLESRPDLLSSVPPESEVTLNPLLTENKLVWLYREMYGEILVKKLNQGMLTAGGSVSRKLTLL